MPNELTKPEPLPPEAIIEDARKKAKILTQIVEQANLAIDIGGRKHLRFEAWQTLGRFSNITAAVEWTRPIQNKGGDIIGYDARAVAYQKGTIVSAAEAECSHEEPNWRDKPLWQLKSMAQTRACAKALRNVLSWIVVLAGYEPTPAEEMQQNQKLYKPNWTWFYGELNKLGISVQDANSILGVKSMKFDWIGKLGHTLEEALDIIKATRTASESK